MWWLAARFDYNYSRMLIVVTCLVLTLSWIIPSICMIAIYKANHPFFERYKIQVRFILCSSNLFTPLLPFFTLIPKVSFHVLPLSL